jgi:hypothetical protein
MPDRSMRMFLTWAELQRFVVALAQNSDIWLAAYGSLAGDRAWIRGDAAGVIPRLPATFRGHLLVCPDPPPNSRPDNYLAGHAVRLEVPAVVNGALQLAQHDTRTERDDVLGVANRLFRRMRNGSLRPVWAWQADRPHTARPYRDISITPGAEAWWRSGKPLGQLGSDVVRFGPQPPVE